MRRSLLSLAAITLSLVVSGAAGAAGPTPARPAGAESGKGGWLFKADNDAGKGWLFREAPAPQSDDMSGVTFLVRHGGGGRWGGHYQSYRSYHGYRHYRHWHPYSHYSHRRYYYNGCWYPQSDDCGGCDNGCDY